MQFQHLLRREPARHDVDHATTDRVESIAVRNGENGTCGNGVQPLFPAFGFEVEHRMDFPAAVELVGNIGIHHGCGERSPGISRAQSQPKADFRANTGLDRVMTMPARRGERPHVESASWGEIQDGDPLGVWIGGGHAERSLAIGGA